MRAWLQSTVARRSGSGLLIRPLPQDDRAAVVKDRRRYSLADPRQSDNVRPSPGRRRCLIAAFREQPKGKRILVALIRKRIQVLDLAAVP